MIINLEQIRRKKMAEDKSQKRGGDTVVTSVSVSKKFQDMIAEYNLSPTECFRRGIAVTLFDLGVGMYQSQKNEDRAKFMFEFLKKIDEDEQLAKEFKDMKLFNEIKQHLSAIKRIAEKVEEQQ